MSSPTFENPGADYAGGRLPRLFLGNEEKPISVGDLSDYIKTTLEGLFADVVIVGEVSNYKAHPASGHSYFSMKDDRASISAVMFKGTAQKLKFKVEDGGKYIAFGRVTVYPPRGNYQIVIHRLEPDGVGALQLAFEQLKKKLEAEGFFDPTRRKPIPKFPRCVALVTASSGAAVRDMLNVLNRRFAGIRILIYSVKVQGEGAREEIAEAILHINKHFVEEVDVMIVGRGGGSIEDLWAFNEEIVARAIFGSKIPIISAVGHEVDFTIADFVADLRAPTPSAAAELVIGSREEVLRHLQHSVRRLMRVQERIELYSLRLDDLVQRMVRSLETVIDDRKLIIERLKGQLLQHRPDKILENARLRLEGLLGLLSRSIQPRIEREGFRLENLVNQIRLLNPRAIMDRGYSIVRLLKTKKVVKKVSDVRMGDELLIELSKGQIKARI